MSIRTTMEQPVWTVRMFLSANRPQSPWRRRALLLLASIPVALFSAWLIRTGLGWPLEVGAIPFIALFCGGAAALWIFGLRPDVLALPLAFLAAFYYFSPAGFAYISSKDFFRIALILAILLAPIVMAWRSRASEVRWHAAHLAGLDGWRAIAILVVMFDHFLRGISDLEHQRPPESLLLGQHGVNIFFGISGLLITWKILEEHQQTGTVSLPGFYRRRVYRIFPPALAFLAVTSLLSLPGWLPMQRLELASTVLYFRNFLPDVWPSLSNAHFWSLSLEEQFYLFLPVAVLWLGIRRLRLVAGILVALCGAWRWYYFHFVAGAHPALSVRFRTDVRLDGLLCGCLMAIILQDKAWRQRIRNLLTTPVWSLLFVAFSALIYWAGLRTVLAESLIIPLLLAGTMLSPEALPCRVLEWRPLRWVGRISYSLYLWQQIFLVCAMNHWMLQPMRHFPLNLILTFGCAACSYYMLERPMLRRAHRMEPTAENAPAVSLPTLVTE